LKWRRVSPSSLSSTLEISPISNFLAKRSSWVLVSLNGGQRGMDAGRKPEREGSSGQPGLVEQRDQLVARERVAVPRGFLGERIEDTRLPVDQGAVHVEGGVGDFLGQRHAAVHSGIPACNRPPDGSTML
jgi:hypothetical protein